LPIGELELSGIQRPRIKSESSKEEAADGPEKAQGLSEENGLLARWFEGLE
jgi:hypothetical protein